MWYCGGMVLSVRSPRVLLGLMVILTLGGCTEVREEVRDAAEFSVLRLQVAADFVLEPGPSTRLYLTGPPEALRRIQVRLVGSVLEIRPDDGEPIPPDHLRIRVQSPPGLLYRIEVSPDVWTELPVVSTDPTARVPSRGYGSISVVHSEGEGDEQLPSVRWATRTDLE